MVIDIIAACLIAVLGGLGVGSGGLFMVYLTMFRQVDQLTAQGMNLLFFLFTLLAASAVNFRGGRLNGKILLRLVPIGMLGAVFGSLAAGWLDGQLLRRIFGGFILAAGGIVAWRTAYNFFSQFRRKS